MFDVYENSLKTGYIGGANLGRGKGKGRRHRFDLPELKQEPKAAKAAAAEKREANSDQVDAAVDEVIKETPITARLGESQLAELKQMGGV